MNNKNNANDIKKIEEEIITNSEFEDTFSATEPTSQKSIPTMPKRIINGVFTGGISEVPNAVKSISSRLKENKYLLISSNQLQESIDQRRTPKLVKVEDNSLIATTQAGIEDIGWISKEKGITVLHLFDSCVESTPFTLKPHANINSIFLLHPLQKNLFINFEKYYDAVEQQQLAELKSIFTALGAKSYTVSYEQNKLEDSERHLNGKHKFGFKKVKAEVGHNSDSASSDQRSLSITCSATFKDDSSAKMPVLHWYKDDPDILLLIKTIIEEGRKLSSYDLVISCKRSSVYDSSAAVSIEAAFFKLGGRSDVDFSQKIKMQENMKLHCHILF